MNKTFSAIFCAVLFSALILATATAQASLTMSLADSSLTIYQGNEISSSFTITSDEPTSVTFSSTNLPSGISPLVFTPTSVNLIANVAQTVTFTIKASDTADLGAQTATINVIASDSNTTSASIDLTVKQNYCSNGVNGNGNGTKVRVSLDDPSSGDDFYPGDNISVDFTVRTNDDIDFTVETELYDLTTQETISDDSLDDSLDNDEQEYTLNLKVPSDINQGDSYIIRIKSYKSDNEDTQCNEKSIPINIKRESHQLTIDKVSLPNTLACDQPYTFAIKIANTGRHDESNVQVKITSSSLNISDEQTKDINTGKSSTYTFTGDMPIVSPGTYTLRVDVTSDSGEADTSDSYTLNLQTNCHTQKQDASLVISQQNLASANQDAIFKTTITNTGDTATTYNINVLGYQSWATLSGISPTQVTLNPLESRDIIITLRPNQNASSSNTFQVQASFGSQVRTQQAIVTISTGNQNVPATGSAFENLGASFQKNSWLFIINVVLILIVIGLIILLAVRPRKKVVVEPEPKEARLKTKRK